MALLHTVCPLLSDVHGLALDVLALHVDLQPVQVDDAMLDGGGHVTAVGEPHLLHHVAATCLEYPAHLIIGMFALSFQENHIFSNMKHLQGAGGPSGRGHHFVDTN